MTQHQNICDSLKLSRDKTYCDHILKADLPNNSTAKSCPTSVYRYRHLPCCFLAARERHDLRFVLPAVPGDAAGEAAQQGRGHPHFALDLPQVIPGPALGRTAHHSHILHLWRCRHAGYKTQP